MSNQIKIGWGFADFTPPRPCLLGGQMYMRITSEVQDPVTVTALTIDNGEDYVIFATVDIVVCRGGMLDKVRDKISKRCPEIDGTKIIISATHAHTTPHTTEDKELEALIPAEAGDIMLGAEMSEYIAEKVTEAIIQSFESRAVGGYAYGYGFATVGHSRRVVYSRDLSIGSGHDSMHSVNGHCQMYGNTNDPDFLGYESGTESFLNAMFTYDESGKMTGVVVNVPCPSQCSESQNKLSADYWNEVRVAVKERFGDVYVLPQCAAAGDLSPRQLHYLEAEKRRFKLKYGEDTTVDMGRRRDIAERIVAGLSEIESWVSSDIRTEAVIKHDVSEMELTKNLVTEEQYKDALAGYEEALKVVPKQNGEWYYDFQKKSVKLSGIRRYTRVIKTYERQQTEKTVKMECHVIRLGEIAFATNNFELFMDYEQRIQARSPAEQTFIIQLAAIPGKSGGSYLPTLKGKANKGYSASIFDCTADATAGAVLVEKTLEQLNKIFAE